MSNKTQLQILDCTIRDGGYANNWQFDRSLVREVYRSLSKSGVDYVELGFRSTARHFDPEKYGLWRFCPEKELQDASRKINGARISIMGDFGKIDPEDLLDRKDSCIDLVRIAVHKSSVFEAISLLEAIKAKGYIASLQCMGYSTYTDTEKRDLLDALSKTAIDYVYVGDSYGSIFPFQIKEIFEPLIEAGSFKVGFHPHNNIQMAFANTLEAIRTGVHIVDATIYGIGRGAGNLPTEILLSYLLLLNEERYNVIPILNCIERYFIDIMAETPWGYQLPYMISGIFNSHPNYSKELLRRREYSMEDIWKALGYVRELKPVGFNGKIIEDLIEKGIIGVHDAKAICSVEADAEQDACISLPPVTYSGRHKGREFLVLANGPTLKRHKPEIDRFIEKYRPVVFGANFLNGLFTPDYHAFANKKRFVSYIETVATASNLILGINLPGEMVRDYVDRPYEHLVFRDILDADFDVQDGKIMCNCRTISVLLIGVAIVMGAERVFVAGMDGYLDKNRVSSALFYDEKFEPTEQELNVERHQWNERFLSQIDRYLRRDGGEGIHILTPTSHSAFYKSINHYLAADRE